MHAEPEAVGDAVWAKMGSHPYWPARVATMGEALKENTKKPRPPAGVASGAQAAASAENAAGAVEAAEAAEALALATCTKKAVAGLVFVNFFGTFDYAWVRRAAPKGLLLFDDGEASVKMRNGR